MNKHGLGLFDTLNKFLRPIQAPEGEAAYATESDGESRDFVSTAKADEVARSETARAAATYATKSNGGAAYATKVYLNATVSKKVGEGLLQTEGQRNNQVDANLKPPEDKILFMSSNPIDLFIELRRLLSAKKAGHSNTFNQANAIMKYLLENNYLTTSKYKKILKKYF